MLRGTETERRKIRATIFSGAASIHTGENDDGTYFADVYGVIIEAGSYAELLRELALILEES